MDEVPYPYLLGGLEQHARPVHVDVCRRAEEVTECEAPALRRRRVGGAVNDHINIRDRLAHTLAGRQVARDPLDAWVSPRLACEDPQLVALAL